MNQVMSGPATLVHPPLTTPLNCQGHVASKLDSGTAAYSSYIGLILTGIVYPQQEDPAVPIDQYS